MDSLWSTWYPAQPSGGGSRQVNVTMISCFSQLCHKIYLISASSISPLSHFLYVCLLPPLVLLTGPFGSSLPILPNPFAYIRNSHSNPKMKKECCHREISCKCLGGLHQLLSYRDVKCYRLLTQMADPDSRTTQLQRCFEPIKGSCYKSF